MPEESELTSSEAIAGVALEGPAGSPGPLPGRRGNEAGLPPDPPLPGSLVQGVDIPALLALGGSANLAIYAITLLAGLLPLRPFDPFWQGAAVALCVNNGGFARLLGNVGPICLDPSWQGPLAWLCRVSGRGSTKYACGQVRQVQRRLKT